MENTKNINQNQNDNLAKAKLLIAEAVAGSFRGRAMMRQRDNLNAILSFEDATKRLNEAAILCGFTKLVGARFRWKIGDKITEAAVKPPALAVGM